MKALNFLRSVPGWLTAVIILLIAAFVFKFLMRGYDYIGYTLVFAAALVVCHRYFPHTLWLITSVLVGIGLAYFIIVEIPIFRASGTDAPKNCKYVIVLGAAVHGDTPSIAMQNRLQGVVNWLEDSPETMIIVSGGQGSGENMTEAQCMYDWLLEHGIDSSRIIMEPDSTSTLENLTNSFAIIRSRGDEPDGNVAIGSSVYHLYRAKQIALSQGVNAYGIGGLIDYPLCTFNYFIREAFAVTKMWVFGA